MITTTQTTYYVLRLPTATQAFRGDPPKKWTAGTIIVTGHRRYILLPSDVYAPAFGWGNIDDMTMETCASILADHFKEPLQISLYKSINNWHGCLNLLLNVVSLKSQDVSFRITTRQIDQLLATPDSFVLDSILRHEDSLFFGARVRAAVVNGAYMDILSYFC